MPEPKALFCPTCRKVAILALVSTDFPFCSDRCRILDLSKWASGGYVISSPIHDPDLLDELEVLAAPHIPASTIVAREAGSKDPRLRRH